MPKSKVIKDLVSNNITLESALRRIHVIAYDLENNDLINWVENEINGYSNSNNLPQYRIITAAQIRYSGINGNYKVKNQPLPFGALDKDFREEAIKLRVHESIITLEEYSKNNENFERDLTMLTGQVYKNTGLQCFSIKAVFNSKNYLDVISNIKTKATKVLINLEKEFKKLDDLDIQTEELSEKHLEKINQKINFIIFDNSVNMGDKNKIKKSNLNTGDLTNGN